MKLLLAFLLSLSACFANAQRISAAELRTLQTKEDSLKVQAFKLETGAEFPERFRADSLFTRMLVRALETKNSFYYNFDSLLNISRLYAPDSSFRLITWQLTVNEDRFRQHGAIQMRTADGSFNRFVLIDKSDLIVNEADTITDNTAWPGALYYHIIEKKYDGKNYYTLLGFDANSIRSEKKVMDILRFENGKPIFGDRIFVMPNAGVYKKNPARFILEYKKGAASRLTYDADLDAVVFDELTSESGNTNQKWTLIPDGEYSGFKWINGKWVYTENLFGGTPVQKYTAPATILDAKGNRDESKLKTTEPAP